MFNKMRQIEELGLSVQVNIASEILDRIFTTISNSDVEEGGKFVGDIIESNGTIKVNILSYIDSGPNASKSATHIIPNGEYQESVFRLIETYNNKIEHIGTWHSHHCNGYKNLSSGDEKGYFESVNHSNYNLNYFFALLVTNIENGKLGVKYYLYRRNDRYYYQLKSSEINTFSSEGKITRILSFMDKLNFSILSNNKSGLIKESDHNNINSQDPKLQQIRNLDNNWIKNRFKNVKTIQNTFTKVISWRWTILYKNNKLNCIYSHPPRFGRIRKIASLKILLNNRRIRKVKIPLNSKRFNKIDETLQKVLNYCN